MKVMRMIEEIGCVLSISGDQANVEIERRRACGQCAEQGYCGTAQITQWLGHRSVPLCVHNTVQARPGDRVVIGIEENAFLRATAWLYGVPLFGLLGGLLAGHKLGIQIPLLGVEPATLFGGLCALLIGLALVHRRAQAAHRNGALYVNTPMQAVMLRRATGTPVMETNVSALS
jgi:sigma-E factor negative regulatory protein RseC